MQNIVFSTDISEALDNVLTVKSFNRIFVIVDENTRRLALPLVNSGHVEHAHVITIGAGEVNKNLNTLTHVWIELGTNGATRHSLIINIGGGVVTDLGGFAATTFKRGLPFVNCPTTLLAAVDAAVGGKTGINFAGMKNEIGCFAKASDVIISTGFFSTLPIEEFKSGYAEMLKHAMLSDTAAFHALLDIDFNRISGEWLLTQLKTSVKVKADIVQRDPHEQGLRQALNLGHTVGHAFESLALQRGKPVPHGYAIAWGLVVETILSRLLRQFDSNHMQRLATFVRENYGIFNITCDDYAELLHFMHHDKKSMNGEINCTLLNSCGNVNTGNTIDPSDMKAALDIYRDLMHI